MAEGNRIIARLKSEIESLKGIRKKLDREMESAKRQGKDDQNNLNQQHAFVSRMIVNLEEKLLEAGAGKNREESASAPKRVEISCRVTIEDIISKEVSSYTLVRPPDEDSTNGMISMRSSIAKGLLDCREGALTLLPLKNGPRTCRILRVDDLAASSRHAVDRGRE